MIYTEVYPKNCYETLLQEREQQKQERLKKWAENNDEDEDDAFDSTQFDESEDPPNNDDADKFVIVLRSNDKTEIRLRVKSVSLFPLNTYLPMYIHLMLGINYWLGD